MKLLIIADKSPRIDISSTVATESVDLVVTLGDLNYFALAGLREVSVPKIGVYGNHCHRGYFKDLGIKDLHRQTYEQSGLTFLGLEGCVRYKPNPEAVMYTEAEMQEQMRGLSKVDVVISHCPPYGIHDDPSDATHVGFRVFRSYLEWASPRYWFHGHTYPTVEETLVQNTKVVYTHGYKLLTI